jgi:hypothetical protein
MKAFTIRWRSARQHREFELSAGPEVAVPLMAALEASGGVAVWQAGTLWKCPGCSDRTVKTEEFLEGLQRAGRYLEQQMALRMREDEAPRRRNAALTWLDEMAARMLGCERDRVYIKDESGGCAYEGTTYSSRI